VLQRAAIYSKKAGMTITPVLHCWLALVLGPVMLQAAAAPPSALPIDMPPLSRRAALLDSEQPAVDGHRENGAVQAFRSGQQGQLARGIEAAHAKAHADAYEDVTTASDGTDRIVRIKTALGVNMCLNWRDVDRFDPGKGKAVFVLACNR
jgi:hypothetical protein